MEKNFRRTGKHCWFPHYSVSHQQRRETFKLGTRNGCHEIMEKNRKSSPDRKLQIFFPSSFGFGLSSVYCFPCPHTYPTPREENEQTFPPSGTAGPCHPRNDWSLNSFTKCAGDYIFGKKTAYGSVDLAVIGQPACRRRWCQIHHTLDRWGKLPTGRANFFANCIRS